MLPKHFNFAIVCLSKISFTNFPLLIDRVKWFTGNLCIACALFWPNLLWGWHKVAKEWIEPAVKVYYKMDSTWNLRNSSDGLGVWGDLSGVAAWDPPLLEAAEWPSEGGLRSRLNFCLGSSSLSFPEPSAFSPPAPSARPGSAPDRSPTSLWLSPPAGLASAASRRFSSSSAWKLGKHMAQLARKKIAANNPLLQHRVNRLLGRVFGVIMTSIFLFL